MSEKKEQLLNKIFAIILFFYFLMSNLSNHNMYSDIIIIILSAFFIISLIYKGKLQMHSYFYFYLAFMLFQIVLIATNKAENTSATWHTLSTLSINFVILAIIYNVIINMKNMNKVLKIYLWASSVSLLTIMILLRNSLFTGRLAHAYGEGSVSFYFLGNAISLSSNSIAFYCAVSLLICLYFFNQTKEKKYIFLSLFLATGSLLTGSRKGILLLLIYIVYYFMQLKSKKNFLRNLAIVLIVLIVLYVAMVKIPALYSIIGNRVEELVKKISGTDTHEGSIVAREKYKNHALNIIPNRLLYGYGVGYFSSKYGNVTEINYLEILVASGIIGFFIYYMNYIIIIYRYLKNRMIVSATTRALFIVFLSLLVYDIGSVTYAVRNILVVIAFFLGSIKLDQIKEAKRE